MTVRSALVIGLGSMGKRRIRNLQRLGLTTIVGFDPREDRRTEASSQYGVKTVATIEDGFAATPDAVVISTPPDLHVRYARQAVANDLPFFMEASVVDDDMERLREEAERAGVVAAPSCTLRFQPSIKKMKELIDGGRIGDALTYTYHSGQYLPDWHPWEDYRKFYAGQRRTGACREIVPFELVWLTWLLGPVDRITAMKAKVSTLDVGIVDAYQVLVRHRVRTLGPLLVEVLAREAIRRCTIVGSDGTIVWDWSGKRVLLYDAKTKATTEFVEDHGTVHPGYVHAEEPYVDEIRAYLDACDGRAPWPYTLQDDIGILGLLRSAEQSSDDGRTVEP